MKNQYLGIVMPVFSALGLALSPMALAQEDGALIEEIRVTATKREQSIYEVPIAISAFEGDKLAAQGIVDIVDIGKFVPNLNITQFSAATRPRRTRSSAASACRTTSSRRTRA